MRKIMKFGFQSPYFPGLKEDHCSKYARVAARRLTRVKYDKGHSWELGDRNKVVKTLEHNLRSHQHLLVPGQSIVTFHNPKSNYKEAGSNKARKVRDKITHAALFLGVKHDLIFAEQRQKTQQIISYGTMREQGLREREILAPNK